MFPSWLLWVIGPVTVLAAALIIFAVVLGIRAGQRQIETQRRQQVGIALQRAIDYQAEGRLQDAVAEYRRVLILDPGNETALAGIQSIVDQATGGDPAAAAAVASTPANAPPVGTPTPGGAAAVIAATATAPVSAADQQRYDQALALCQAGEWEQAVELLLALQQSGFRPDQVEELLYNCYVNLAAEYDQAGDLQRAVEYVDKALALRPDSTALSTARTLAANYLEAVALESSDLGRTVALLEAIYLQNPTYRDVATRLQAARLAYGDELALQKEWCKAEEQYTLAIAITVTPGSISRRDELQARCTELNALLASGGATLTPTPTRLAAVTPLPTVSTGLLPTATLSAEIDGDPAAEATDAATPVAEEVPTPKPATGAVAGRILYSALDPVNGRNLVYLQDVAGGAAQIVVQDAQQPVYRPDGYRLVYRDLRSESRGLTSLDPSTDLRLRFTEFAEDAYPSWNAQGNLIAFSSNREGDRRWRIYVLWADVNNEAQGMGFGQAPAWHPTQDRLAYQGCDETGNQCGLWSMAGSGGDRRSLTNNAADTRPDWSPDGSFVAFMSEGRDGNPEIYRIDPSSNQVTRLTNDPAVDALPAVSPDGGWVAFMSSRGGAWGMWAVPAAGGEAQLLFAIPGGVGAWQDQELQWIP
jgi:pentatricopeptide repeat protein